MVFYYKTTKGSSRGLRLRFNFETFITFNVCPNNKFIVLIKDLANRNSLLNIDH